MPRTPRTPSGPSERFVRLMNSRYDRVLEAVSRTWGDGGLEIGYDGEEWTAQVAVRPAGARDRWLTGSGVTLERALADLETELGLDPWEG